MFLNSKNIFLVLLVIPLFLFLVLARIWFKLRKKKKFLKQKKKELFLFEQQIHRVLFCVSDYIDDKIELRKALVVLFEEFELLYSSLFCYLYEKGVTREQLNRRVELFDKAKQDLLFLKIPDENDPDESRRVAYVKKINKMCEKIEVLVDLYHKKGID